MFKFVFPFAAGVVAGRDCPFLKDEKRVRKVIQTVKKNISEYINENDATNAKVSHSSTRKSERAQ